MAWTIVLEDSEKNIISSMDKEFNSSQILDSSFTCKTNLLKYLDPYGDTIFNRLQMNDLVKDILQLMKNEENPLISKIIELCQKCKSSEHLYIIFYGD